MKLASLAKGPLHSALTATASRPPQVKGTDAQAVRAVQVHEHCSSLNSADCFVLQRPGAIIVWKGSKSSPVM